VGRCGVGQKQNAPQIVIYQIVFAPYSIDYTTVSKFIKFDHQLPCHGGWRSNRRKPTAACPTGGKVSRRGPRREGSANVVRHGGRSPEPEKCFKIIEINRKKIFLVEDPLTGKSRLFSRKKATLCAPWGWNPQPVSHKTSLATTLHNHMCPY
jgi:hypothetical protein